MGKKYHVFISMAKENLGLPADFISCRQEEGAF
jgi:hypothetical protein